MMNNIAKVKSIILKLVLGHAGIDGIQRYLHSSEPILRRSKGHQELWLNLEERCSNFVSAWIGKKVGGKNVSLSRMDLRLTAQLSNKISPQEYGLGKQHTYQF